MRWDEQRVENDLRLPGVGDGTVVRTFDAPEAMGINFHEVRARSALNYVPGGRYGFSYTINPYRGCTHACVFCLVGETPILMADGETRALRDLRAGEEVIGTVRHGSRRRFAPTEVLAHWETRKPGYRVLLEDGAELVASGDHRFLSGRGWKYVGVDGETMPRPHLTLDDELVGVEADRGIVAIEPLGREVQMFDITTGSGDFVANGVVSHNCFARRTHTYLDLDAGRDFEREIVVKVNVPELLRAELGRPSWKRDLVALGTNTDPYQWVESRYQMMPEILEALERAETPVSVLTKSPLAMRDVRIFERMAKRLPVSVNLSVPTLDEDAWRATEPHTPSPAARLDAVAELRRRGIDSGVLIAPLMPGINDSPDQVRPIVERARKAGATFLGGVALHLRDEVKDVFFGWLQSKRPDLLPKYESLYSNRAYMRPEQRKRTTQAVRGWGRNRLRSSRADRSGRSVAPQTANPPASADESSQSSLF
jgi:DNA repair photolyase